MYPGGATPEGVLDLTGNVWEWCRSLFRGYPYAPEDGRNTLDTDGVRVLRGGSWGDVQWGARCASRLRIRPGYCIDDIGSVSYTHLTLPTTILV